jgi:hypothetical protein
MSDRAFRSSKQVLSLNDSVESEIADKGNGSGLHLKLCVGTAIWSGDKRGDLILIVHFSATLEVTI